MSKRTSVDNGTVEVLFSWGIGARGQGRFGETRNRNESAVITAEMYVRRGSDVQARDRVVRANGEKYVVVGHSLWDQNSAFSGRDFGWMGFQVQSSNG